MQQGVGTLRILRKNQNLHRHVRPEELQESPQARAFGKSMDPFGFQHAHRWGHRIGLMDLPDRSQMRIGFSGPPFACEVASNACCEQYFILFIDSDSERNDATRTPRRSNK